MLFEYIYYYFQLFIENVKILLVDSVEILDEYGGF
jgi:hypothetical protein